MQIQVIKERTALHSYALVFPYVQSVVDFCRVVKDKFGWEQFSFSDGKWRFDDLSILEDFEVRYELLIDSEVKTDRDFSKRIPSDEALLVACRKRVSDLHVGSFKLRPYQEDCLTQVLFSVEKKLPGNDLLCLACGAGKSLIIAGMAKLIGAPILILVPSKELLEQNMEKLSNYIPRKEIGVYSASMNEKTINSYTFATIQSVYRKPEFFKVFKTVIIDECDLVNPKDFNGMFMSFLRAINCDKVFGLTATPYRLDVGYEKNMWGGLTAYTTLKLINRLQGRFWQRILYNMDVSDLQKQGYLSPLEYIDKSVVKQESLKLNKSGSDFDLCAFDEVMKSKVQEVLSAISYAESISKSVIVFCASIKQAKLFSSFIPDSRYISSKTEKIERKEIVDDFKKGKIKTVFNVNVLATGFDKPDVDCVVLIRPTRSLRLYYQQIGRLLRMAQGKTVGRVIDLTSNVASIGRVESIKLVQDNGRWDVQSETGMWHGRMLYSWKVESV